MTGGGLDDAETSVSVYQEEEGMGGQREEEEASRVSA